MTRRQDWAVAQSCLFYLKNYAIKSCLMQILYQGFGKYDKSDSLLDGTANPYA